MFDGVAFVAFVVVDGDSEGVLIMRCCDDSNKIPEIFKVFELPHSLCQALLLQSKTQKVQKPESIRCY